MGEAGAVKTPPGLTPIGEPETVVPAIQIPAVFAISAASCFF
jgi:hypothetical protein